MLLQDFLRAEESPLTKIIGDPYFVKIKEHPTYTNLIQFTYDQIESPKIHPMVKQCRGIILDSTDNWKIIAYPFNRFFNYGESCADEIDWSTAKVQEKIDGSLMIVYWYDNKWNVATKGSPNASGNVGTSDFTFADLFWGTVDGQYISYWEPEMTYMFELASPYNRVVCSYSNKVEITLLGMRSNVSLREQRVYPDKFSMPIAKVYDISNFEMCVELAATIDPIEMEGFVVVDENFNRVKVKSPAYVAIHHLRDGSPERRLMDLIKTGEESELLSYRILDEFPHEKAMYEEMKFKLQTLVLQTQQEYDIIKHITLQKDFALEAIKSRFSAPMFSLKKCKTSTIQEWFLNQPSQKLLEYINFNVTPTI